MLLLWVTAYLGRVSFYEVLRLVLVPIFYVLYGGVLMFGNAR